MNKLFWWLALPAAIVLYAAVVYGQDSSWAVNLMMNDGTPCKGANNYVVVSSMTMKDDNLWVSLDGDQWVVVPDNLIVRVENPKDHAVLFYHTDDNGNTAGHCVVPISGPSTKA